MKISKYLIYFLPAALVTGPFFSEIILIFVSINFLFLSIKNNLIKYYKNNFTNFFLFFYLIINISSIFSEDILYSLKTSFFYIRFYFFSISFIYLIKSEKNFLENFFYVLVLTISIVSLSGYIEYFFNYNFSQDLSFVKEPHRLSGFFGNELIIGSYVARLLPLIILLAIYLKKNTGFFNILLIFNFFIIFLSGERTSLLLGLISYFAYIVFSPNKIFTKILLFFISIIISLFIINSDQVIKNRIITETKNQIYNQNKIYYFSKEHTSHYKSALKMFFDRPFLGHGPKSFRLQCKNLKYYENIHSCTSHPHNFLLQLLAEIGIMGLFLVLFFFHGLINFFKNIKNHYYDNAFCYLPIIIFSNPFFPNGNFFNNWLSIISFISISFSIYLIFIKNEKN